MLTPQVVHVHCEDDDIIIEERFVILHAADQIRWEIPEGSVRVQFEDPASTPVDFQNGNNVASPGHPAVGVVKPGADGGFFYHLLGQCHPGAVESQSPVAVLIVE